MSRLSRLALGLIALAAVPATAQPLESRLDRVESALAAERREVRVLAGRAADLGREAEALAAKLVALAEQVRASETALAAVEARIAALAAREAASARALEARQAAVEATVAGLYRLARHGGSEPLLLARSESLAQAARARMVLAAALPALDAQARRLGDDLARLARLRAELAAEREVAAVERQRLVAQRAALDAALADRRRAAEAALARRDAALREVARLAARARDLGELVARLGRAAPPPPGDKPALPGAPAEPASITAARGSLAPPAVGRLVERFGDRTEAGPAKGIRIATASGARVVTPFDGRVAFAGPFRGLGRILIIEHAEGYHTLLAGLARIDCQPGQWLLAGEPVGVMASPSSANPVLYVELRRDGEPINPLPWLAAMDRKVSG